MKIRAGHILSVVFAFSLLGCGTPRVDPGYDLVNMEEDKRPEISEAMEYLFDASLPPRKPTPNEFRVLMATTKGSITLEIYEDWGPIGVERFHHLVDIGYYTDIAIFRAISNFMFQFGIHGEPAVNAVWKDATIKDEGRHPDATNEEGTITFARTGAPDSRTNQLFINLGNNARLDNSGFHPFGRVIEGMDVVRAINTQYGENREPNFQQKFQEGGNAYAEDIYPELDYIVSMTIVD